MCNIITKIFCFIWNKSLSRKLSTFTARLEQKKHHGHFTDGQTHFVSCTEIYKHKLTLSGPEAKAQSKLCTSKKLKRRVSTWEHLLLSDKVEEFHWYLTDEIQSPSLANVLFLWASNWLGLTRLTQESPCHHCISSFIIWQIIIRSSRKKVLQTRWPFEEQVT